MDLEAFNLNLLRTFEAIFRKGSVSAAAAELGLTQPAVSAALARLRSSFGDPLFVRTSRGLHPTSHAHHLAPEVTAILARIRVLGARPHFDPAASAHHFRIHVNDVGLLVAVPELLSRMLTLAPQSRLTVEDLRLGEVIDALDSGRIDLALGYMFEVPNWARQQRLKSSGFVCGVRSDHPTIGDEITLEQYLAARHASFVARGSLYGQVDEVLAQRGLRRDVAATVQRLGALPFLVRQTDLVMTVPQDLGLLFRGLVDIRLLPVPLALQAFPIRQYWHERLHADAAQRWFRALVRQVVGQVGARDLVAID